MRKRKEDGKKAKKRKRQTKIEGQRD